MSWNILDELERPDYRTLAGVAGPYSGGFLDLGCGWAGGGRLARQTPTRFRLLGAVDFSRPDFWLFKRLTTV